MSDNTSNPVEAIKERCGSRHLSHKMGSEGIYFENQEEERL
jgi:hypothetical protein